MLKYFLKIVAVPIFFMLLTFNMSAQSKKIDSLLAAYSKSDNDIARADLLNTLSDQYKTSDPKLMQDYASKALQLAQKIKYETAQGNALLNLGNANIIHGEYSKALQYFTQAQQLFEKENQTDTVVKIGLARVYGSMGVVFSEQSNYAKALQFYLKAVSITETLGDRAKSARLYNNIGVVYQALNDDFR